MKSEFINLNASIEMVSTKYTRIECQAGCGKYFDQIGHDMQLLNIRELADHCFTRNAKGQYLCLDCAKDHVLYNADSSKFSAMKINRLNNIINDLARQDAEHNV